MYTKSATAYFNKSSSGNFVGYGHYQIAVDDSQFEQLLEIAIFAESEKSYDSLVTFIKDKSIPEDIFRLAIDKKIITKSFNWDENPTHIKNKYFLDLLLDSNKAMDFSNHHVVVIGCGGIGNFMCYPLSTMGIGMMSLIDGDKVEYSNLNRQFLFNLSSIGKSKVNEVKEKIETLDSNLVINKYKESVSNELLEKIFLESSLKPSIIILSADDGYCLNMVNDFCIKFSVPFINVGYLNDFSVIGPFYIPGVSSCPYCQNNLGIDNKDSRNIELDSKIERVNNAYIPPAFFTNNAFASGMALIDIAYFFNGKYEKINSLNKRIGIDNHDFSLHSVGVEKNALCKCGIEKHD